MMKKVMFWQLGDTVVRIQEPTQTWLVAEANDTPSGAWIKLDNTRDPSSITGYEIVLQGMGFIGFR